VAEKKQFATCLVDDLFFGIEVERVQEVTKGLDVTPVPLAPPQVRGLLNLRGQIVTAIDLRCCLQLTERPADESRVHMILDAGEGAVSLLVDDVGGVLEVDEDDFELPPETLRGRSRELIRGAYKLDESLLLVLDTDRILNSVVETAADRRGSIESGEAPKRTETQRGVSWQPV
jgi:purine-binding chemotaxis protein CheW